MLKFLRRLLEDFNTIRLINYVLCPLDNMYFCYCLYSNVNSSQSYNSGTVCNIQKKNSIYTLYIINYKNIKYEQMSLSIIHTSFLQKIAT